MNFMTRTQKIRAKIKKGMLYFSVQLLSSNLLNYSKGSLVIVIKIFFRDMISFTRLKVHYKFQLKKCRSIGGSLLTIERIFYEFLQMFKCLAQEQKQWNPINYRKSNL